MHQEITRTLEKITSREKYINSQMEGPIAEYRRLKDRYLDWSLKGDQSAVFVILGPWPICRGNFEP